MFAKLTRREALKIILLLTGGFIIAPALSFNIDSSLHFKNIAVSKDLERLLTDLVETLIPQTKATPSATEVEAHLFLFKMVDNCMNHEDRMNFISGVKKFSLFVNKRTGLSFGDCCDAEKTLLISRLEERKTFDPSILFFYETLKKFTIEGYVSSKYYMTSVLKYRIIPGSFKNTIIT